MHSQHLFAVLALALPVFASYTSSRKGLGCYSDVSSLTAQPDYLFEEPHHCTDKCSEGGYRIAALSGGSQCSCGHELPSDSDKVDDDKCNLKCRGYPGDICGGNEFFTVLTTAEYSSSDSSSDSNSDSNANAGWGRVIITTATAAAGATPSTAGGGIVVAPTNIDESNLPTGILTAPASMISKASSTATSAKVTSVAAITAANADADASSTPSSTPNAADSLRAAPVAGILVAGLGLLL